MTEPISATVAVRHPLPFVYGVAADVARWPAFWPACRETRWESGGSLEGQLLLVLSTGPLRRMSVRGRFAASPGRIRFEADGGCLWFELSLSDDNGGTLVSLTSSPGPSRGLGLVGPRAAWRRAMEELLPALRRRLDDLAWLQALAPERPEPSLLRLARG